MVCIAYTGAVVHVFEDFQDIPSQIRATDLAVKLFFFTLLCELFQQGRHLLPMRVLTADQYAESIEFSKQKLPGTERDPKKPVSLKKEKGFTVPQCQVLTADEWAANFGFKNITKIGGTNGADKTNETDSDTLTVRISVVLPGGSRMLKQYNGREKIRKLLEEIEEKIGSKAGANWRLVRVYPHYVFTSDDFTESLDGLHIQNNTTLKVEMLEDEVQQFGFLGFWFAMISAWWTALLQRLRGA